MPVVLFKSHADNPGSWKNELARYLVDLDFRIWPDLGDAQDIEYLLIWGELGDLLDVLPNVKLILSLGAGVDGLGDLEKITDKFPVIRLVDDGLTQGMSEFVILNVLRFHRLDHVYHDQQIQKIWKEFSPVSASKICVGIMGLGVLGMDAARKLNSLNYEVLGWSRTPKSTDFCSTFYGEDGLHDFLERTNILVCLLPLTAETDGILCKKTFSQLPANSCLVNAGRGRHLVEADLLEALASGQLRCAAVDVFHDEPLPKSHPFWENEKIILTPHIASMTNYKTAAKSIATNIKNWERGKKLEGVVNSSRGY